MEATETSRLQAASALPGAAPLERLRRIDWSAVSTWLLGFGLVAYLGLEGGGFDPLIHDQVGIALWWVFLATVLVGAVPRRRPGTLAWCSLGLFVAFVAWTALSLSWTESAEKTSADLARVAGYLGVFALALFTRDSRGARRMVAAVGTGIAFVSIVALLSRLHPAWFPEASQTASFFSGERLSYPLNYWNALAALIAIGLPLMLQVATGARSALLRALAAAALPAMVLTIFFTLSRGGIAAAIVALAIFLALTSDRLPKLLTLLVAGAGGAILIAAAIQRDALQQGFLNTAARDQGNEMLAMTIVVCAGVGLVQAGISLALLHDLRPRWTLVSRRQSLAFTLAGLLAVLVAAASFNAPGRASDAWSDFKRVGGPGPGGGTERLASVAGESRYQFWAAAVREDRTKPLTGTGAATFEYWWARDGDTPGFVEDAHSLYMQTLGELGLVGFALLAAFLAAILLGGTWAALRARRRRRPQLAAAVAGSAAFCITAVFDWMWQIPVLPVAMLLLAAVLVGNGARSRRTGGPALHLPLRAAFAVIALAAIVAIAIPLASGTLIRQSQTDARAADLPAALRAARSAQNAQPGAATPRLQQALLLEAQGNLAPAAAAARAATERESTNWRTWLVLSRIEAEQGRASPALRHYRRAKSLNPRSSLLAQ